MTVADSGVAMVPGLLLANMRWLIHALGLKSNPLRRSSDRLTAVMMIVLLAVVALAIPVAATAGNVIYEQGLASAAVAASTRRHVDAVVIADPKVRVTADVPRIHRSDASAEVRWTGVDGAPRTETIDVHAGTLVGSKVGVWVDSADRIATAPPTERQVLASAVMSAVMVMLAVQALCIALIVGIRLVADVRARRAWQREWEIVGPKWTRLEH